MDQTSGSSISVWLADTTLPSYPPLTHDAEAAVCVVGAGIAGLSVAYELQRAGRSVVVLEDGTIGSGETGRTTAHLSNAFDDRYATMKRLHGAEGIRILADSHTAAIDAIERIVRDEHIVCDFERLDGYLFVPPGESQDILDREIDASLEAGLTNVTWVDRAPMAFDTGRCLRFADQAQFHPLRYLAGLARAFVKHGGRLFCGTHAAAIESSANGVRVTTGKDGPVVTARDVVVATNTPIQDLLKIHTKQYPYRTYAIGCRVPEGAVPRALFWDTADPYHYVRLHRDARGEVLIVGGEDHKTGQESDPPRDRYGRLERWARDRFPVQSVAHAWSGQVLEPVDGVAFIGRNPGDEHIWIVTGDSGNGMTHGALAGLLLRDLVTGAGSPWEKLYDPARKPARAALEFARENLNMVAQYADWITGSEVHDAGEIPPGEGAVLREGMKKVAVYRDPDGRLHRLTAVCPHLGGILAWNTHEHTWDCPAHGSRFDALGHVVNGPANSDLAQVPERDHDRAHERRTRTAHDRHTRDVEHQE